MTNIFIPQTDTSDDISGKLTYTSILESIPENKVNNPIQNWQTKYKTEWRWRFLKFDNRHVVEISYLDRNSNVRMYFNKYGKWVNESVAKVYNQYIDKEYYAYTI
jgi:hypothetical protein